jgi:methyl-accepting chemotaxis protein
MTQQNAQSAADLNNISNAVDKLSQEIELTISQAQFESSYKKIVCDPNLAHTISKYKRDHIAFKNNNFKQLKEYSSFKVIDHNSCNMGRWIHEQESLNAPFTKNASWNELKNVHQKIHGDIQSYIDENAKHVPQSQLAKKALEIENHTLGVFEKLNKVLEENCNG